MGDDLADDAAHLALVRALDALSRRPTPAWRAMAADRLRRLAAAIEHGAWPHVDRGFLVPEVRPDRVRRRSAADLDSPPLARKVAPQ